MFWLWVLVGVAVLLAAAWWYDRRGSRRHVLSDMGPNGARGQIGTRGVSEVYQQENPRAQGTGGMFGP